MQNKNRLRYKYFFIRKKKYFEINPSCETWKEKAILSEKPMDGAGGSPYSLSKKVLLRQFFCPNCGYLLDTETAIAGDPFLNDVVKC